MKNKYTFMDLVKEVFEIEKRPLTYTEIWESAEKNKISEKVKTTGKTPWDTIGSNLYVETRDNPNSIFVKVSTKPSKFYLKGKDFIETKTDEKIENLTSYNERDLHPILVYFLNKSDYFNAHSKTIYHEVSIKAKKGKNKWDHPDIVAFTMPYLGYGVVREVAKHSGYNLFKTYSFELKKEINWSNYKEFYFQAVSNSSWAHEGYLVIADVKNIDKEFLQELNRLSNSYGIGVLHLNISEPLQSKILVDSKVKNELDFQTMKKISDDNTDFKDFLSSLNDSVSRDKVINSGFDSVLNEEQIISLTSKIKK